MSLASLTGLYHNGVCSVRLLFICAKRRHAKTMTKNNQLLSNTNALQSMGVSEHLWKYVCSTKMIEWFVLCWQAVIVEVLSHHQMKTPVARKLHWIAPLKIKIKFCFLCYFCSRRPEWWPYLKRNILLYVQFCALVFILMQVLEGLLMTFVLLLCVNSQQGM